MMDDDLIVVDDVDDNELSQPNGNSQAGPSYTPSHTTNPRTGMSTRHSTRPRPTLDYAAIEGDSFDDDRGRETRSTRASTLRARPQPKLKLKLSEKAAAQAPGMSFLGPYDRELDSDDEDLAFEEQFILRMPPGEDCERLKQTVAAREVGSDVWFKFKDSRRAIFHMGNNTYSAKLVDLPCIIESQKTLDNKQMFKVADICQMLVVGDCIPDEDVVTQQKSFNVDEFIWPHGITPPLHWVRKRRFRKRLARSTIETVEQEVERLLEEDALASDVKYDVLENVNPDMSDSEFIERDEQLETSTMFGSELGEAMTPGAEMGEGEGEEEGYEEGEGDIDEELAAELDLALVGGEGEEAEEEEEEEEESSEEEEDEDEDDELAQARKVLNEEIRDLEAAVAKKGNEIASSANPLIRRRFEDAMKKLQADLEMKLAQREQMYEQRSPQEGDIEDGDTEGGVEEGDGDLDADLANGLFGDDEGVDMDVG
ncbi:unnamed protein product [Somion occarium]|uniref:TAFII55 protein conserved region domain-containing protein n=1 Tax=Somion occarium TaxID=3059160 RepID=A0ABP1DC33_9APHY